jgi:hypothetical protein
MSIETIKELSEKNDVRVSEFEKDGKTVYGLHGFKSDIQAVVRKIDGFYVEWADTGAYLYDEDESWN